MLFDSIHHFADWLEALPAVWIYATIFVIAYGENVVPPVPGDVAIVIGGYLVGLGLVGFVPLTLLATLGSVLGFLTMYGFGKKLGDAVEDPGRIRWIPKGPVRVAKRWLQRWGYGVVAVNRFLSGARAVIALLAGASDLRFSWTVFFASFSALVWTVLLMYAGYAVGANWEAVIPFLRTYGQVISIVVALLALIVAVRWWWRRRTVLAQRASGTAPRNREDTAG